MAATSAYITSVLASLRATVFVALWFRQTTLESTSDVCHDAAQKKKLSIPLVIPWYLYRGRGGQITTMSTDNILQGRKMATDTWTRRYCFTSQADINVQRWYLLTRKALLFSAVLNWLHTVGFLSTNLRPS